MLILRWSKVELAVARLVQLQGGGLRGALRVEAAQGVFGERERGAGLQDLESPGGRDVGGERGGEAGGGRATLDPLRPVFYVCRSSLRLLAAPRFVAIAGRPLQVRWAGFAAQVWWWAGPVAMLWMWPVAVAMQGQQVHGHGGVFDE